MTGGHAYLERVAVSVPDVDAWVHTLEALLGPGFTRSRVQQTTGPMDLAIHPGGVELVASDRNHQPTLRSFHLVTSDLDHALAQVDRLGWQAVDQLDFRGRAHHIFSADGLRVILVAAEPSACPLA